MHFIRSEWLAQEKVACCVVDVAK